MTDKLREAAENLIEEVEQEGVYGHPITQLDTYQKLKASLKPSKEEIADWLEEANKCRTSSRYKFDDDEIREYINHAIDYLRK